MLGFLTYLLHLVVCLWFIVSLCYVGVAVVWLRVFGFAILFVAGCCLFVALFVLLLTFGELVFGCLLFVWFMFDIWCWLLMVVYVCLCCLAIYCLWFVL